jgi:hypothetical protein
VVMPTIVEIENDSSWRFGFDLSRMLRGARTQDILSLVGHREGTILFPVAGDTRIDSLLTRIGAYRGRVVLSDGAEFLIVLEDATAPYGFRVWREVWP